MYHMPVYCGICSSKFVDSCKCTAAQIHFLAPLRHRSTDVGKIRVRMVLSVLIITLNHFYGDHDLRQVWVSWKSPGFTSQAPTSAQRSDPLCLYQIGGFSYKDRVVDSGLQIYKQFNIKVVIVWRADVCRPSTSLRLSTGPLDVVGYEPGSVASQISGVRFDDEICYLFIRNSSRCWC